MSIELTPEEEALIIRRRQEKIHGLAYNRGLQDAIRIVKHCDGNTAFAIERIESLRIEVEP